MVWSAKGQQRWPLKLKRTETLKATTVPAVSVKPSYSRPRVSDDNACAEALFRTANYKLHTNQCLTHNAMH